MKKFFILGITVMVIVNIYGQFNYSNNTQTLLEEKFEYGVSWAFFHLGTLTLTVEGVISDPD